MAKAQVARSEPHKAPYVILVQHKDAEEQETRTRLEGISLRGDWLGDRLLSGSPHLIGTDKDKSGAGKLALLAGDTLYTISNPEKATGHEGHTVKVTGKTERSTKTGND